MQNLLQNPGIDERDFFLKGKNFLACEPQKRTLKKEDSWLTTYRNLWPNMQESETKPPP